MLRPKDIRVNSWLEADDKHYDTMHMKKEVE